MEIAIIGGGASGILAAYAAKQNTDVKITLFEKNEKLGKKIYITGKGRCNITNALAGRDFLDNVVTNPKFLFSAISEFDYKDIIKILNDNDLKTKVERGGRVFPTTDKSSDVIKALTKAISAKNVEIKLNTTIKEIKKEQNGFILKASDGKYNFNKVIVATGGLSYRATGSTGDGYQFLKQLGHTIVDIKPSLVGLIFEDDSNKGLQGLSLKNVSASIVKNNKVLIKEFGEMLFTHNGVSGPIILTISAKIKDYKDTKLVLDLKPALDEKMLDERLIRDFDKFKNRYLVNGLDLLLPQKLIEIVIEKSNIDKYKIINSIKKEERLNIVKTIKNLAFDIKGLDDINRSVVVSGGISVREINPQTMESKIVKDLYITGELIDVDALTGGFNMQIAFSTGYLAGKAASTI